MEEGDYYTVDEAARILKLTPGRIRQMLRAGELEGDHDEAGRWRIPMRVVHDRPRPPRVERPTEVPSEPRGSSTEAAELRRRVEELQRELGRLEGEMRARRELAETAESTLREQLARERERADAERVLLEQEREHVERLQAELARARRPWWRKLFGNPQ